MTRTPPLEDLKAVALLRSNDLARRIRRFWAGHFDDLVVVRSVSEARKLLRKGPVHQWIVDQAVPSLGALTLVREIRSGADAPSAAIVVAGRFEAKAAVRFQSYDAVLLPTPFRQYELRQALLTALRRSPPNRHAKRRATKRSVKNSYGALAARGAYNIVNMAELVGISARHLQRHFQSHFDIGGKRWMSEYRLALALKSLQRGSSVQACADRFYFTDNSLTRAFRRLYGITPGTIARGRRVPQRAIRHAERRLKEAKLIYPPSRT